MAKKTSDVVVKSKLQETMDRMNKTYGIGTVLTLDGNSSGVYDVIPTGSIGFDYITLGIGGFAKGKLYEIMGWEGCLTGDTKILFRTISKLGIPSHKGGSMKTLYEKFNNLPLTEKHKKKRKDLSTCYFTVPSINEDGFIVHSKINDVVYSGKQPVYELKTAMGYAIKATANHKFYTGETWTELSLLNIGDDVYIHNRTTFKKERKDRVHYKRISVKYHPKWRRIYVEKKYEFYENHKSRAIVEAHLNNMDYLEYISFLNTASRDKIDKLNFIPNDCDVHHINEDVTDNRLENLMIISSIEHTRYHANKNQNNLRFMVIPDSIISIEYVGEESTYDIICEEPYRNFVANGIVVHNSGKSTVCGHATAECQKAGGTVLYIDGEHAVDKPYFQSLGVDTTKLLIAQPSTGEEGFNVAVEMIKTGEIDLVIIDSDSSLIPKAVIDGDVGESSIGKKARLNNNAYPKLKSLLIQYKTCMIVISQYREKIGVMFGNPTTTQGGHALKFYTDCRIEITKSMAKDGDVSYGNITKVKATKNKMCPPYRVAQFEVVWGKGIDKIAELVELAVEYEIINKSGSWYSYGDTKLGQGTSGVTSLFEDNPELCDEIRQQVIDKLRHTEDLPIDETSEEETILAMANV